MTIVVAGHTGLVGSAIFELLESKGEKVIGINRSVIDLLDRKKTFEFINDVSPSAVIDSAAIVGGIGANSSFPVNFLSDNLQIQSNLMDASHAAKVERFVFLGSSCIYPRNSQQPIKEEYLMTGPLETSNSAYAVAKIAGIELIRSYRKQFGKHWISLMPTNVYGPNDNFNVQTGHVLPALIHRFEMARISKSEVVTLWGSGQPKREFIFSKDLAEAIVFALEFYDEDLHLNVGTGEEISILALSELIASETDYHGRVVWDLTKLDGTPRKLLDISRLSKLGWVSNVGIAEGVKDTIKWFRENQSWARL